MTQLNLCNKCNEQIAVKTFDHEALCESCTIDRLVETVERLVTGYVTIDAEIRYEPAK
jgi:anaerobic ribonucleoside-triphosphate reductase